MHFTQSSSCVPSSRRHLGRRARTRPPGRPISSTCKMVHSFSLCVLACGSLLGDGTIGALGEECNCCCDLCVIKLLKVAIGDVVDLVECLVTVSFGKPGHHDALKLTRV